MQARQAGQTRSASGPPVFVTSDSLLSHVTDGSVRLIRNGIDLSTYRALATINGREAVNGSPLE